MGVIFHDQINVSTYAELRLVTLTESTGSIVLYILIITLGETKIDCRKLKPLPLLVSDFHLRSSIFPTPYSLFPASQELITYLLIYLLLSSYASTLAS